MEGSRTAAREALERTIDRLKKTVVAESPSTQMDRPVRLEAVTPHLQILRSSFGREVHDVQCPSQKCPALTVCPQLWFASLHAVHHWSMVRRSGLCYI